MRGKKALRTPPKCSEWAFCFDDKIDKLKIGIAPPKALAWRRMELKRLPLKTMKETCRRSILVRLTKMSHKLKEVAVPTFFGVVDPKQRHFCRLAAHFRSTSILACHSPNQFLP